jgi:mannose-6-phosphate isomerase
MSGRETHAGAGRSHPAGNSLLRMRNPIRDYEWGSPETLARMQRREPSGRPEAELWIGAHPAAPSTVLDPDGSPQRLDELVARAPQEVLGEQVTGAFGPRLPFLLKVLAIARPLSLQVHPDGDRAREGFEGEVEGPGEHRYTDPYPKPELLYALEPVEALCGFRPAADAARLLSLLDGPRSTAISKPLRDGGEETAALEAAFELLVTWPDDDRADLATDAADEARRVLGDRSDLPAADRTALEWVTRLAEQHPKDALVVAPLLLDLVRLRPGETLFVPAGAPHAYLRGTGVEIMGSSDNVLRAGLTHKPVAVAELLHVVDGRSRPHRNLPEIPLGEHEVAWRPPVPEFQLTRLRPAAGGTAAADTGRPGPQVLLCTAGEVTVSCPASRHVLRPGESVFAPAGVGPLLLAGPGEVFRAAVGSGVPG